MTNESRYMARAIALAGRGQGYVEPNPMVGCVIVKGGRVVGEGYHRRFGGSHAETNALAAAGRRARGATLYVTLEPCCHIGKTPPCVEAIIRAGVRRVVAAVRDPNPLVAGKGFARLRRAGIKVDVGLMKPEAEQLAAPFIVGQTLGRAYVILKWAQSIDGKIATRSGDSKWITSIDSRRMAHALRARVDAIVVGVETVLADDPELTARWVRPKRVATRVVLDSRFRTPLSSRVVRSARRVPTLVVGVKSNASAARRRRLESAGCQVLMMPGDAKSIDLARLLAVLRQKGMSNVLVEGGGMVLGGFLEGRLADEAIIFVGPKLIGGETAPGPLRHRGPRKMTDLPAVEIVGISHVGEDLCYHMRFSRSK